MLWTAEGFGGHRVALGSRRQAGSLSYIKPSTAGARMGRESVFSARVARGAVDVMYDRLPACLWAGQAQFERYVVGREGVRWPGGRPETAGPVRAAVTSS
jgi:hypothetical protein